MTFLSSPVARGLLLRNNSVAMVMIPNNDKQALDELMKDAEILVQKSMRQMGEVSPTLLIASKSDRAMLQPGGLHSEDSKDEFLKVGRIACLAQGAVATVLVTEAWMVQPRHGRALDLSVPPSQSPDRMEIISIMGETRNGHAQKILPILRSEEGKFVGFGVAQEMKADEVQGRFSNFLSKNMPDEETQLLAKKALIHIMTMGEQDEKRKRGMGRQW